MSALFSFSPLEVRNTAIPIFFILTECFSSNLDPVIKNYTLHVFDLLNFQYVKIAKNNYVPQMINFHCEIMS